MNHNERVLRDRLLVEEVRKKLDDLNKLIRSKFLEGCSREEVFDESCRFFGYDPGPSSTVAEWFERYKGEQPIDADTKYWAVLKMIAHDYFKLETTLFYAPSCHGSVFLCNSFRYAFKPRIIGGNLIGLVIFDLFNGQKR